MKFTINNTIDYNSSDGTLFSAEHTVDTITLSRICNELLLLFVQNCGIPLSRDFILNEIWEKRGLSASSNNLNNYVSMLRKALAQCGYPELITTIPRHGFIFEAKIHGTPLPDLKPLTVKLQAEENCSESTEIIPLIKKTGSRKHPSFAMLSGILTAVVLGGLAVYGALDIYRLNTLRSEIFRTQNCRFYATDDLTRRIDKSSLVNRISTLSAREKIDCTLQTNVYYSVDRIKDVSGQFNTHELLSYCAYNSSAPCENYTYIRSEVGHEIQE